MDLAPIVLFAYNRPLHVEQVLESLAKNTLAKNSLLYVFSDGSKQNAKNDDIENIRRVRDIVNKKKWCGKVIHIQRENNFGLAKSIIEGVTQVINKHGKVIVLEDDIITSENFLSYMNEALNTYKDSKQVFGVSGYKYPTAIEIDAFTYFLPIACSWSYATWQDRWEKVNFDGKVLLHKINAKGLKKQMNFGNYPFYQMLVDYIEGKNDSWAIRFYAAMIIHSGLFLYPNLSLVENIGFDGTGVHCETDGFFDTINLSKGKIQVEKKEVKLNSNIVKIFKRSFRERFKEQNTAEKATTKLNSLVKNIIKKL